jgi:hypothetical protein
MLRKVPLYGLSEVGYQPLFTDTQKPGNRNWRLIIGHNIHSHWLLFCRPNVSCELQKISHYQTHLLFTEVKNYKAVSKLISFYEFTCQRKTIPHHRQRFFKNSVAEIGGELLQNAQRAGASEIHFFLDREAKTIVIRDDGSGIAPDKNVRARILRMADSFYQNSGVECNQKSMGAGLLSLFALDGVQSVAINSRGKRATIETGKLWESESCWANWTDLITDAPDSLPGFELTVRYDEPKTTYPYSQLTYKFEYALTKYGDGFPN